MTELPKWVRHKTYSKRIGFWLFAFHHWYVRLIPNVCIHEPSIDEPNLRGWSVVWLGLEVAHVRH